MAYTKEILTLAVEIADTMLRNGAEIYRVEDAVIHILDAYDIEDFDVYVLSNGIFASANEDKEDACSMIRHVPLGSVNLGKISALNQLTRDICNHKCSLIDSWTELERCKNLPDYPLWIQTLFCGLGTACFCYLFGGRFTDSVFCFVIGCVEQLLLTSCKKYKINRFMTNIFACLMVTLLSMLALNINPSLEQDMIIIGAIMPLVPGIAFTTSIRDFYNGDYLSGLIHLTDAVLTAVCVAIGASLPFAFLGYMGGL